MLQSTKTSPVVDSSGRPIELEFIRLLAESFHMATHFANEIHIILLFSHQTLPSLFLLPETA